MRRTYMLPSRTPSRSSVLAGGLNLSGHGLVGTDSG